MFDERLDKLHEECGVFGIYAPGSDVARISYYGLFALQHRGQESAGIAVSDGSDIRIYKNMGLVTDVFDEGNLRNLNGHIAVGHVRYSTTGASQTVNAQPLVGTYLQGSVAVSHNGNLTNTKELRHDLTSGGSVFQTTIDTEIIMNLIARYGQNSIEEAMLKCMIDLKGSYALAVMTEDKLVAVRDPYGNRPLCIGKFGDKGYVVASESCALDLIGAEFLRDVEPGEIVVIDGKGLRSSKYFGSAEKAVCVFEYIYFARPDSNIDGLNVNVARRNMGKQLAEESPKDVDIVIAVPDSGTAAAVGYAEALQKPFELGLLKNKYVGRTFIQPSQEIRELAVRMKLNPIRQIIEGKKIAIVDDSIVRGTTSRKLVEMLRNNGAKEIHFLVSSPPVCYSCHYGIDTSDRENLIAACKSVEETCAHIGADSLSYLSREGLFKALGNNRGYCSACFDGDYPIPLEDGDLSKDMLEKGKKNGK